MGPWWRGQWRAARARRRQGADRGVSIRCCMTARPALASINRPTAESRRWWKVRPSPSKPAARKAGPHTRGAEVRRPQGTTVGSGEDQRAGVGGREATAGQVVIQHGDEERRQLKGAPTGSGLDIGGHDHALPRSASRLHGGCGASGRAVPPAARRPTQAEHPCQVDHGSVLGVAPARRTSSSGEGLILARRGVWRVPEPALWAGIPVVAAVAANQEDPGRPRAPVPLSSRHKQGSDVRSLATATSRPVP